MIATIINCNEILTLLKRRPALKFKIEVENEIHYVYVALDAIHYLEAIWKHLHLPIIIKYDGGNIIQTSYVKNKILPVDEDSYNGHRVYKIATKRLNK